MILEHLYQRAVQILKDSGVSSPQLDARLIIMKTLVLSHSDFITQAQDMSLSNEDQKKIQKDLDKRCKGMPVSRIFGEREFWGLPFRINAHCLDPRPETETLIEAVLSSYPDRNTPLNILDLGTGSGCILLSLLHELPNARGVGGDISFEAVCVARSNAQALDLENRVHFVCSDWGEGLVSAQQFDVIVSNPPYIESDVIPTLERDVALYDPILALDGGKKGLNPYKKLISKINFILKQDGKAFFEIGKGQESDLMRLVEQTHATLSRSYCDIAGNIRVVEISCGDKQKKISCNA